MSIAPNLQPFIIYHLRIIGFRWIKIPFLTLKYFLSPWTTKSIFIICWSGAHLTKVTVNSVNYSVWICVLFLSTAFCNLRDCNTYICKTLFIQSTRSVWWHVSMFLWLKTPLQCSTETLRVSDKIKFHGVLRRNCMYICQKEVNTPIPQDPELENGVPQWCTMSSKLPMALSILTFSKLKVGPVRSL